LNHPNIAQIYGAGVAEHVRIAMELVEVLIYRQRAADA
jgi:hypothetical protein